MPRGSSRRRKRSDEGAGVANAQRRFQGARACARGADASSINYLGPGCMCVCERERIRGIERGAEPARRPLLVKMLCLPVIRRCVRLEETPKKSRG